MTLYGMSSSSSSSSSSMKSCRGWSETETGSFLEAAVDGLMSCRGEGDRLMCAVCRVSASWRGMEVAIVMRLWRSTEVDGYGAVGLKLEAVGQPYLDSMCNPMLQL